jgi:hypothetical protein
MNTTKTRQITHMLDVLKKAVPKQEIMFYSKKFKTKFTMDYLFQKRRNFQLRGGKLLIMIFFGNG